MNKKDYIDQMNNIHASEELIQKTIKSINASKKVEEINRGFKVKRFIAGTAAALTLAVGSAAAYTAITGNSILSLMGLEKASLNYEEQSINVSDKYNTVIENEYTKVELKNIACDKTFLILEYDIKMKDKAIEAMKNKDYEPYRYEKAETDYDFSQGGISENVGFSEQININGKSLNGYTCFSQKVDGSENEYKLYDLVDLNGLGEYEEFKASIAILAVLVDNSEFYLTNENNNYLIDFSVGKMNESKLNNNDYKNDNVTVTVKDAMNTSFATYVTVGVKVSGIDSNNCLNDIDFQSFVGDNKELDSNIFLNKYVVRAKDGYAYDVINDDENYKYNDDFEKRYLLNSKNKNQARNAVEFSKTFSDAEVEMEFVIVYPEVLDGYDKINCEVSRNGKKIIDNVDINIGDEIETNTNVSNVNVLNYTDEEIVSSIFLNEDYRGNKKLNKSYNPNADKINFNDISVCGIKLGMSKDEAIKTLSNYYKENGIYVECEKYFADGCYKDNYLEFSAYNGYVTMVNAFGFKDISKEKIYIDDIIKSYYSEEYLTKYDSTINTLYGYDEFKTGNGGSFGYVCIDSAERTTMVSYHKGKISYNISADPATGIVKQIILDNLE